MVHGILGLDLFEKLFSEKATVYDPCYYDCRDLSCHRRAVERNSSDPKVRVLASRKHRYLAERYISRIMA